MRKKNNTPKTEDLRLFDLLVQFQQGDKNCYESIINHYGRMLSKASYNSYIGGLDDDLRAEIHLALFLKLRQFIIPDSTTLRSLSVARENGPMLLQSVPV